MKLRPHQQRAVDELWIAVNQYHRVVFVAPTGFGKSYCTGYIVADYVSRNKKVLIVSSRTEIMMQNVNYTANGGTFAAVVNPKVREIPNERVISAMAQTLHRRVEYKYWRDWLLTIDAVVIDEAHEVVSDFLHPYLRDDCEVIGMTATPVRYGKSPQMGSIYNAITNSITIKELVDMGYLARPHLYSIAAPELGDVSINPHNGEYNTQQLAKKFQNKQLYTGVVDEYVRLVNGKKTICFCVSSEQAIALTKEFNDRGISAKYVLSGTFDSDEVYSGERSEIFEEFKRGCFDVLCNVSVCTAGLDIPSIEVVICNFATTSLSKWKQAVGRGARVTDTKKEFWILDCGNNVKRHGHYLDEPCFCLWHDEGTSGGIQMLKECDPNRPDINGKKGCGEMVPNTCKVCPKCGRVFVTEKHESIMHLEEIASGDATTDLNAWAAQKYHREGWNLNRVFIQIALANVGSEKAAITATYRALFPQKTPQEVNGYWYMFKKQFMPKLKRKAT